MMNVTGGPMLEELAPGVPALIAAGAGGGKTRRSVSRGAAGAPRPISSSGTPGTPSCSTRPTARPTRPSW